MHGPKSRTWYHSTGGYDVNSPSDNTIRVRFDLSDARAASGVERVQVYSPVFQRNQTKSMIATYRALRVGLYVRINSTEYDISETVWNTSPCRGAPALAIHRLHRRATTGVQLRRAKMVSLSCSLLLADAVPQHRLGAC